MMFIRYPGSKAKLGPNIIRHVPVQHFVENGMFAKPLDCYCEPFFGSGAIAWDLLPAICTTRTRVVVNDKDPGIAALWRAVHDEPKELVRKIRDFTPSAEKFFEFKEQDGDLGIDPVRLGFQKLALHQMSFSGLGYKAGGPLGGRSQDGQYKPDCRWNPVRIAAKVLDCHRLMKSVRLFEIHCEDFAATLGRLPASAFAYLDPPYYKKGDELYRHSMADEDHARLAAVLQGAAYRWILSYDDHERIRQLYSWAHISSFEMTATIDTKSGVKRRKNREIVIRSLNLNGAA